MVDRPNKPSALATMPDLPPQAQVSVSDDSVSAVLPSGECIKVLFFGATVVSWNDHNGDEKLWFSKAAKTDGSKPVRGGIPLAFPVFGTAPSHSQSGKLPQHGFARNCRWEFLGKSTSECRQHDGDSHAADLSVKLDFGLGSGGVPPETRALWPYAFGLVYSVTLARSSLTTSLVVTNDGDKPFDCHVLMHTYLRVRDIAAVTIAGLEGASYIDRVDGSKIKSETSPQLAIAGEIDRVYTTASPNKPIFVSEDGGKTPTFSLVRDNLADVVVWNPWADKARSIADFEPKDAFKNMVCVEAGSVAEWQTLDPGDAFEGAQTITTVQAT